MKLEDIVNSLGEDEAVLDGARALYVISKKLYAKSGMIAVKRVYVLNVAKLEWEPVIP